MAPLSLPLTVSIRKKRFPAVGMRPEIVVLKDLEFTAEAGSFVVITGPSGGGKTTLLNIIAGLDKDFEGKVDSGAGDHQLRLRLPVAAAAALAHGLREHRAGASEGRPAPR